MGVDEFVERDGLLGVEALGEVFAFEHLRDGELGHELDHVVVAELVEPLGVIADLGFFGVEDLEDLLLVRFGVGGDLLGGEGLAGDVASGGVADEGGGIADEEDDGVAEELEVAELADKDGVAEVEVGRGGVEAGFNAERVAGREGPGEALFEGFEGDDLGGALGDEVELIFYGAEGVWGGFLVGHECLWSRCFG